MSLLWQFISFCHKSSLEYTVKLPFHTIVKGPTHIAHWGIIVCNIGDPPELLQKGLILLSAQSSERITNSRVEAINIHTRVVS